MKQFHFCCVNCSDCNLALNIIQESVPCFVQVEDYTHTKAYFKVRIAARVEDEKFIREQLGYFIVEG